MAKCGLCHEEIGRTRADQAPRVCSVKGAIRPALCWQDGSGQGRDLCAQSLRYSSTPRFQDRVIAFRQLADVIDRTPMHVRSALLALTSGQRFELMRWAVPELKLMFSPLLADLQIEKLDLPPSAAPIPDDLPERLKEGLAAYRGRLERRRERLLKKGHVRSPRYLPKLLQVPIGLAKYLASQGITSWEGMRKRDMVGFLAANPKVPANKLSRLLRALFEDKPFRDGRGRRSGGKKGGVAPKPLQEVMSPEELDQTLADIRASCSDAEY